VKLHVRLELQEARLLILVRVDLQKATPLARVHLSSVNGRRQEWLAFDSCEKKKGIMMRFVLGSDHR
jgi:hypothetical protein